jgi:hypothetical protein
MTLTWQTLNTRDYMVGPPLATYRSNHWVTQTSPAYIPKRLQNHRVPRTPPEVIPRQRPTPHRNPLPHRFRPHLTLTLILAPYLHPLGVRRASDLHSSLMCHTHK